MYEGGTQLRRPLAHLSGDCWSTAQDCALPDISLWHRDDHSFCKLAHCSKNIIHVTTTRVLNRPTNHINPDDPDRRLCPCPCLSQSQCQSQSLCPPDRVGLASFPLATRTQSASQPTARLHHRFSTPTWTRSLKNQSINQSTNIPTLAVVCPIFTLSSLLTLYLLFFFCLLSYNIFFFYYSFYFLFFTSPPLSCFPPKSTHFVVIIHHHPIPPAHLYSLLHTAISHLDNILALPWLQALYPVVRRNEMLGPCRT